ncbi:sugar-transfer associated ATP-grasp domain-containing protein [Aestuariicoccus sp. MJ-SS9]|uniref:sugar-transfer associated ATP-grasp domain-containing protein n=1 Tax=Aestuariicoccus sp. MJ-SS9 TaxID=3079855 RepID=UPI00290FD16C|nr:sugar-transfer associated ATP-grasp domain-containing protein [Aestuariicoccus sp. MJ-SS9]MDU8913528.1 sugar-transfer associated ATP-grasp domain-containing protein [Aestuariicoccus sp. MJ-SS9]
MSSLWPLGAAMTAAHLGAERQASPARILDAWWLAMRCNVPPKEYFVNRLWRAERRRRLDDYLYFTEDRLALTVLNKAAGWQPGPCPVSDKRLFSDFCKTLDLPTPQIIHVWRQGVPERNSDLAYRDLWLKPSRGWGGTGAERWVWKNGQFWRDGLALPPRGMARHIARHSRQHGETLVQEVLYSCPDHAPLIGPSPLCARILTGRRRNGLVDIVDAMAVWPNEGSVITQGGRIAMIDTISGRIGTPHEASETCPSQGLEGTELPDWNRVLDHVRKGHGALPHYVFLGWDVAFSEQGPVLLEANSGWGCFHFQVLPDHPIADTPFASIAEEYI